MPKIRCLITMGDPSGIGPETIAKALRSKRVKGLADFTVVGDAFAFRQQSAFAAVGGTPPFGGGSLQPSAFSFIDLKNVPRENFKFGKVRAEYGRAAWEYVEKALELIKAKEADCLVTCPVNKEALKLAGCDCRGHTEYIARYFAVNDEVMMLFNDKLKVSLVTQHVPLKDVPGSLNRQKVFKAISVTNKGLIGLFGIRRPKIAVCGLNPHASDNGALGEEEKKVIIPAIKKAKEKGILVAGPYPADTIFLKAEEFSPEPSRTIDCVIAMYHDQGLIPLKLTGFKNAVNITLGLPFVRTSPAHGTAFDIAGKNIASAASLIQAIKAAIQCAQNPRKA